MKAPRTICDAVERCSSFAESDPSAEGESVIDASDTACDEAVQAFPVQMKRFWG